MGGAATNELLMEIRRVLSVPAPVEFKSREWLRNNTVTGMIGYGTYSQPPGTWSDDTSMTLCLLNNLTKKSFDVGNSDFEFFIALPDYNDIMQRFLSWMDEGKHTARGEVFDVGIATRKALQRFGNGTEPLQCGGTSEQDNGNGSMFNSDPCERNKRIFTIAIHKTSSRQDDSNDRCKSGGTNSNEKRKRCACPLYGSFEKRFLRSKW